MAESEKASAAEKNAAVKEAAAPKETTIEAPAARAALGSEASVSADDQPTVKVRLKSDSGVEAPAAVAVPGLQEAGADLDEHGRLVLGDQPVEVSAHVGSVLLSLSYVEAAD
jgi:hypothetical protein